MPPTSYNSQFSADVKGLWKLGFRHVGAHARCGIVCKSLPFLSTHVQSLQIIHLSNGYFPKKRPKSHEEVPTLSSYEKDLESHV